MFLTPKLTYSAFKRMYIFVKRSIYRMNILQFPFIDP